MMDLNGKIIEGWGTEVNKCILFFTDGTKLSIQGEFDGQTERVPLLDVIMTLESYE